MFSTIGHDQEAEAEHVEESIKLRGEGGIAEFLRMRREFDRNTGKL